MMQTQKRSVLIAALLLLIVIAAGAYAIFSERSPEEKHKAAAAPYAVKGHNLQPPKPIAVRPRD